MQWGVCSNVDGVPACAEAGYDYVELATARDVAAPGDDEWLAAADRIRALPLPVPVCNLFFPGDLRLVGPNRDHGHAVEYAGRAFERLREIGTKVQVFGSGGARRAPEGYSVEQATDELKALAARLGPVAANHDVVIAMEHLRAAECNVLTTLAETLRFVREVNHPAVQVLVDGYHVAQMSEPYEVIRECGKAVVHVHLADPATRHEPAAAGSDFGPLFRELKAVGYDVRASLECGWQDRAANLKPSRDLLAAQWADAKQ